MTTTDAADADADPRRALLAQLATEPGVFFRDFRSEDRSWIVAATGYLLASVSGEYGDLLDADPTGSGILLRAVVLSIISTPLLMLVWGGLWFGAGAKMMRGSASIATITKAIGYSFLVPGLVASPILCGLYFAFPNWNTPTEVLIIGIPVALFAAWSMVMVWKAVRWTSHLSALQMTFTMLWLPGLLLAWIFVDEFILGRVFD